MAWIHDRGWEGTPGPVVRPGGPADTHGGWALAGGQWCHSNGSCVSGTSGSPHGGWRYQPDGGFNMVGSQASLSLGGIGRAIGGVVTGIIPGTLDDRIFDAVTNRNNPGPMRAPTNTFGSTGGTGPCGRGSIMVRGRCVDPGAALPGGDPFISPPRGTHSLPDGQSLFGLYREPDVEVRQVRSCGPGLVLGKDGLCYDSRALSNNLRMYPKPTKPPISAKQMRTLKAAESVTKTIKSLNKKAGLRVPTKKKR